MCACRRPYYLLLVVAILLPAAARAASRPDAQVVGLIPKAQQPIAMDGTLNSWAGAFITPLNATNPDFLDRATDIYYLWDDQALYIGVRALDTDPTHISPDAALYDGDAVEFYLDTRAGGALGGRDFGPGTLHMFFTAVTGHDLKPRWHVRDLPAFKGLELKGVEMAAARTPDGYTLEFKLPWSNFPAFAPRAGTPIGIDVEMGSADGGHRIHRTFAYSSPTSVGTPATFGRVLLVDQVDPAAVEAYSRALFPFDAQVPGNYGWVFGTACLSPTIAGSVARVEGKLKDASGKVVKTAQNATLHTVHGFWPMWHGAWETFDLPAGTYTLVLSALDPQGRVVVERTLPILLGGQPAAGKP